MKAYVSAKYENQDEVRRVYKLLAEKGYEMVYDWTTHDPIKPYKDHPEKAGRYAKEESDAIFDCDLFIHLTVEKEGTAMFVELGIAIALSLQKGTPKIYIVGDYNSRSTFYYHPSVVRKNSIEEVLAEL
jgi:hypothetical protein